jgi:hypothetical protein
MVWYGSPNLLETIQDPNLALYSAFFLSLVNLVSEILRILSLHLPNSRINRVHDIVYWVVPNSMVELHVLRILRTIRGWCCCVAYTYFCL